MHCSNIWVVEGVFSFVHGFPSEVSLILVCIFLYRFVVTPLASFSYFFEDCVAQPAAPSRCWLTCSGSHMLSSCVHMCVAFTPGRKDTIAVPLRCFRLQASLMLQETLHIGMARSTIFPLHFPHQLRKVRPIFFC